MLCNVRKESAEAIRDAKSVSGEGFGEVIGISPGIGSWGRDGCSCI
jgi:hypothetical protein